MKAEFGLPLVLATIGLLILFTAVEYMTLFYWFQLGNSGPQGAFFLGLLVEHLISLVAGVVAGMLAASFGKLAPRGPVVMAESRLNRPTVGHAIGSFAGSVLDPGWTGESGETYDAEAASAEA